MDKFKKDKSLLNGKGENDDVEWITVKGNHIPLKQGETPQEAIKKHFGEKEISKKFNLEDQVDKVLKGTYKDSHITLCEETPKVLQDIGVPNKPFLMTAKHAYLTINENGRYVAGNDHYHNLGKELFCSIPKLLQSPVMVFKNHNMDNEIIAIINAVDKNKKPVILPIKINGSGRQNFIQVEANIMKSAYGKNNLQRYIDDNVRREDILLIENKKIRNLNS